MLEQNLIKSNQPRFNILLRDDKTFPYIEINEKQTTLKFCLKELQKHQKSFMGHLRVLKELELQFLNFKIFLSSELVMMYFSKSVSPMLQYQIGKCSAPCVGKISQSDYLEDIKNTKKVLKGNFSEIIKDLKSLMKKYSHQQAFEKAGEIKIRIEMLRRIEETQIIFSGGDQTKVLGMASIENDVSFVVIDIEKNALQTLRGIPLKIRLVKVQMIYLKNF